MTGLIERAIWSEALFVLAWGPNKVTDPEGLALITGHSVSTIYEWRTRKTGKAPSWADIFAIMDAIPEAIPLLLGRAAKRYGKALVDDPADFLRTLDEVEARVRECRSSLANGSTEGNG